MADIVYIPFPVGYKRLYEGPFDPTSVQDDSDKLDDYLSGATAYAGQVVSNKGINKVYFIKNDKSSLIRLLDQNDISDLSNFSSEGTKLANRQTIKAMVESIAGGGGGHVILSNGTELAAQPKLNFVGDLYAEDNNTQTVVRVKTSKTHSVEGLDNYAEQLYEGPIENIRILFDNSEITSFDVSIRPADGDISIVTVYQNTVDGVNFTDINAGQNQGPSSSLESYANLKGSLDKWYICLWAKGDLQKEAQFEIISNKYTSGQSEIPIEKN